MIVKNRAVTNQCDRSYVHGDAVISSPRPADHTIAGSNLINLACLPMELVSDALHSSNMRISLIKVQVKYISPTCNMFAHKNLYNIHGVFFFTNKLYTILSSSLNKI